MIAIPATHCIWILEDHEVFAKQIRRLIDAETDMVCPHHFTCAADLFDKLKFTSERPDRVEGSVDVIAMALAQR